MTKLSAHIGLRRCGGAILLAAATIGPTAALLVVWLPEVLHYHVRTLKIDEDIVTALRSEPDDAVFARIDGVRFGRSAPESNSRLLADEMLAGRYHTREGEVLPVGLAPTNEMLTTGSSSAQLQISSMVVAATLLAAYRETGDERYFDSAMRSALAWARFERNSWLPVGFLWNDHAIAARVLVLTSLWGEYRKRADFDPDVGLQILTFIARSTTLLARPSHYTVRTNHGIMQNLALLHAAIAFPLLPGTQKHTRVAVDRLAMQLPFYVTSSGVVLEHSAGYQDFAIHLLRSALDYLELLGIKAPPGLWERYSAAECLQRHITRPDMSLPSYGDTLSAKRPEWLIAENGLVSCPRDSDDLVDEDIGIASMRNFGIPGSHLFMAWEAFAGRSHKHDDELATWLWFNGQDWWTASGYWPYGDADRDVAVSWRGANAPHAVGEVPATGGDSRLLYLLRNGPVQVLDVQRKAPDGHVYRRQVFGLDTPGVLILDSTSGGAAGEQFESVWTLAPGVSVHAQPKSASTYALYNARSKQEVGVTFVGAGDRLRRLFGSRHPFGGLVARDGIIRPSEALVVSAPMGTWSAAFWCPMSGSRGCPASLSMDEWQGPERWSLTLSSPDGVQQLVRRGVELSLTSPGQGRRDRHLERGATTRPIREQATMLFREAAELYPPFHDYVEYRVRASAGIGALLVAQIAFLWLLNLLHVAKTWQAAVLVGAWATVGWWLYHFYLI